MRPIVVLPLVALVAAGGVALHRASMAPPATRAPDEPVARLGPSPDVVSTEERTVSPFEIVAPDRSASASPGTLGAASSAPERSGLEAADGGVATAAPSVPPAASNALAADDVAAIGRVPWTGDAEFARHVERLRGDPAALAQLLEEFRAERDAGRLLRLAALLGELEHPARVDVATDMVRSGDATSRAAGLALLQRLQPDSDRARDVLVDLLASESDPVVLVAVLDALSDAVPDDAEQTGAIVAQLLPLTAHDSPAVRRHGLSILSRWGDGETVTAVLTTGLSDADAGIRHAATYAFADHPSAPPDARQELFAILENPREPHATRSGALLALARAPLDSGESLRLQDARRELRRRPAQP